MTIQVNMSIQQARDIVAVYREELEPTWYGSGLQAPHRNDFVRRATNRVSAVVIVVERRRDDPGLYWVKVIHESEGPAYHSCPISILDLLTPTDDPEAQEWRVLP
jgi:hypothetical protein